VIFSSFSLKPLYHRQYCSVVEGTPNFLQDKSINFALQIAPMRADKLVPPLIAKPVPVTEHNDECFANTLVTRFGDKPLFSGVFFYGTGQRIAVFRK